MENQSRSYTVHTLGPAGTNCESAAYHWLGVNGHVGNVRLHRTLEDALSDMPSSPQDVLLGCAVYPDLHKLVFSNLSSLELFDSFVMPTYNMVLAARASSPPRTVASHPAPRGLVPNSMTVVEVTSNAEAARRCAAGDVDGCITTVRAAINEGLETIEDFGPVPMVFTMHRSRMILRAAA